MKFIMPSCILLLTFNLGLSTAWAIPDTQKVHSFGATNVRISGPADSPDNMFGKIIANSGSRQHVICNNPNISYNLGKIEYTLLANWTGESFQSSPAHSKVYLYESGVEGLSLAPTIRGDSFNSGMTGVGVFNPAPPEPMVVWTGNMSDSNRKSPGFWAFTQIYVYKGAKRLQNATIIPRQPLFRFTCYDTNNVAQETSTFVVSDIYIYVDVASCTPDAKATTVNMDGIPVVNIENATSSTLIGTKQQTFSLKCDPNIKVSYSVVDLNDRTNNTNTSTLTSDSTAAGVGYAITSPSGARLQFGPDGSAVGIPGQIKYFLGNSGTAAANNPMSFQLGFSYVRKPEETIKTGTAKSLIGITYSYQ
ncbi:fimbrial protein [Serratia fonticola]